MRTMPGRVKKTRHAKNMTNEKRLVQAGNNINMFTVTENR